MIKYWLKLWSINEDLFEDAIRSIKDWFFDFIELYVIPWKFNKKALEIFVKNNIKTSIHAPHSFHWFNPIWDDFENTKKIWEDIKQYIDFLNPFQIVLHPEIWNDVKVLEKRLQYFNNPRIIIENMPKKSSILANTEFYWYSLDQIKKINSWFCFDFAKAKSSAVSQWLDPKKYILDIIELVNTDYFHISWFLKDTEVDEHFDLWEWDQEMMVFTKNILIEIWNKKDIFVVFECKKKNWVKNDLKNLDYFNKKWK